MSNEERANGSANAEDYEEYLPVDVQVLTLIGIYIEQYENLIDGSVYYNIILWFRCNIQGRTVHFCVIMEIRVDMAPEMMAIARGSDTSDTSDFSDDDSSFDENDIQENNVNDINIDVDINNNVIEDN